MRFLQFNKGVQGETQAVEGEERYFLRTKGCSTNLAMKIVMISTNLVIKVVMISTNLVMKIVMILKVEVIVKEIERDYDGNPGTC